VKRPFFIVFVQESGRIFVTLWVLPSRGVTGKSTSQSDQKDPATVRGFLKAEVVDTLRKSCPSHESRKARISGEFIYQ
jgi:hypothetical protein